MRRGSRPPGSENVTRELVCGHAGERFIVDAEFLEHSLIDDPSVLVRLCGIDVVPESPPGEEVLYVKGGDADPSARRRLSSGRVCGSEGAAG